jgi:sulfite exporter TauE/SafE
MVLVGLYMSGAFTKLRAIEKVGLPVWRKVEPLAKRLLPVRTVPAAFALGLTWGFMPCGLVYGALGPRRGYGQDVRRRATMLAFGLGTLPMMLAVGAFSRLVAKLAAALWVRRAAGLAIVFFGAVNVATGHGASGCRGRAWRVDLLRDEELTTTMGLRAHLPAGWR